MEIKEFKSVLAVVDFLVILVVVSALAWLMFSGITTRDQTGLIVGLSTISGLITWMVKVLCFGLPYSSTPATPCAA
ncbi:hypothetical protein CXF74_18810 [Psychromonas sp. Urea-02u-13]|nr:hypothetical protein CXF74_18810 [Psychromonas sp. Urea-02u-13]